MDIYSIIDENTCDHKFSAKNKDDALKKISALICKKNSIIDKDKIYTALKSREDQGSTAFGNGIAIPHAKIQGLNSFNVSIIVSKKGVDFNSLDKKKTHIFFVLVGPSTQIQEHLQILAQISRMSRNKSAKDALLNAGSTTILKETFIRFTMGNSAKKKKKKEKKQLLLVILNELKFLDDIIEIFVGKGIHGVNVLESVGVKDQLSNIPLFSDFLNFLGERRESSKTLMALVPKSEVIKITTSIEEILGDLDTHSGAFVAALDLPFFKGSLEL